jgi:hypothetical protein
MSLTTVAVLVVVALVIVVAVFRSGRSSTHQTTR